MSYNRLGMCPLFVVPFSMTTTVSEECGSDRSSRIPTLCAHSSLKRCSWHAVLELYFKSNPTSALTASQTTTTLQIWIPGDGTAIRLLRHILIKDISSKTAHTCLKLLLSRYQWDQALVQEHRGTDYRANLQ